MQETDPSVKPIGRATMSSGIMVAANYHRYLYRKLRKHLIGKVWEIGCGYGQYTQMLLEDGFEVLATDIDNSMLQRLEPLHKETPAKLSLEHIDLCSADIISRCLSFSPNSIICLNVLEHISEDRSAIRNIYLGSELGTRVVFLTPALQALYGFMDREAGHYRRYSRQSLRAVFKDAGWHELECFYCNPIGALGWYIRNKIYPPKSQDLNDPRVNKDIELFDKYALPLSKCLDPFTRYFFGQSVVFVGRK